MVAGTPPHRSRRRTTGVLVGAPDAVEDAHRTWCRYALQGFETNVVSDEAEEGKGISIAGRESRERITTYFCHSIAGLEFPPQYFGPPTEFPCCTRIAKKDQVRTRCVGNRSDVRGHLCIFISPLESLTRMSSSVQSVDPTTWT